MKKIGIKRFIIKRWMGLSFLSFVVFGCGSSNFTRFSKLGGLRITAVQVEDLSAPGVAEIDGTRSDPITMRVTPFISDLNAEGRVFQVSVTGCVDPGVAQGAGFQCENPQVIPYPNSNSFDTSSLSGSQYSGPMTAFDLIISDPAALIESRSEMQKFNGVSYLLTITLSSGGESLTLVKAIPITTRTSRNRNPEIDEILLDGEVLSGGPTKGGKLGLRLTPSGEPEIFEEMTFDGQLISRTEDYLITWFYSEGRVRPFRTVVNQDPELILRTAGPVLLMVVVRDRRGGVTVRTLE